MLERAVILAILFIAAVLIPGLLMRAGNGKNINFKLFTARGIELNRTRPSVIYFWSDYCAPCASQSVILNNLKKKYLNVNFISLNAVEEKELAASFKIKTVPSIVLSSEKEIVFLNQGITGEEKLKKEIEEIIDGE